MSFTIKGISPEPFRHLFGMSDEQLKANGVKRYVCDEQPGFPDRVEMRDAQIGETLLLVNHTSMDKKSPYKASHAIFVREGAEKTYNEKNTIPPVMYNRLISLRAFDRTGMMLDAEIAKGNDIKTTIERMLTDSAVEHIDAHNAIRGCFSGRITRS